MRSSAAGLFNTYLKRAWVILPAILLGVIAMISDGVSAALWGKQIAAFVVFAILGLLCRTARKVSSTVWSVLLLAALAATLFFPKVEGAKRWLDLGLININAAMLVVPALIVLSNSMKHPHWALVLAAAVLCLQPDLSQLAVLSLGALPILWQQRKRVYWTVSSVVILVILAVRCLAVPVHIEPVSYCEGVLDLLGNVSPLMQIAGAAALVLIPGYFLYRFMKNRSTAMLGLAICYAVTILFSLTGEYPVPFMGYGLSPIAGYWFASLFLKE